VAVARPDAGRDGIDCGNRGDAWTADRRARRSANTMMALAEGDTPGGAANRPGRCWHCPRCTGSMVQICHVFPVEWASAVAWRTARDTIGVLPSWAVRVRHAARVTQCA